MGVFNDWIPPVIHTGFYSVTDIDTGDDTGYYIFLRSLFFDGDLDFYNELFYGHIEEFNSTGYVFNNWQIGQSFLIFPFFILGHFGAIILNALGYSVSLDGYSFPYHMALALASQTYLFLGLLITFQINRKYFSEVPSLLATLMIWVASPLIYYTFIRQRLAHTVEFFLAALFILVWLKNRDSANHWKHALMGGIVGFLGSVRIVSFGLVVIYIVDQLWSIYRFNFKSLKINCLIFFALFGLLFFSTQLITWQIIEGFPLPGNHIDRSNSYMFSYSITTFFKDAIDFFFGYKWGILYSSPIILLGILGAIFCEKLDEFRFPIIMAILAYVLLSIYVLMWIASYQYRYIIPIYPLASIGLGYVISEALKSRFKRLVLIFLSFVLISAQYLILIQYKVTLSYQNMQFVIKALSNIPAIITEQPELLLRSTNIFKLLSLEFDWTYKEFSYLVLFPLFQFILLIIGYVAFNRVKNYFEYSTKDIAKTICISGAIIILTINIMLIVIGPEKSKAEIAARQDYLKFQTQIKDAQKRGRFDEVVLLRQKAVDAIPDFWIAHLKLAISQELVGLKIEANKNYEEALRLNPHRQLIKFNMAQNLIKLGELDRAEDLLRLAIRDDPTNPKPYQSMALLVVKRGRFEEALILLEQALTLNPNFGKAHFNLAVLLMKLNRVEEAKLHFTSALNLEVKNPALDKISKLFDLKKDTQE